ncbi:MAG: DUF354 domain-containing protein [Thermodesulfobacteriota bacterium]|nr:DUF354 domain-containing protein [Thermodesulfobacteriota bacterium]
MNFLFDIGHPAHVHLFRNFISYLKDKGHDVHVVSRDKDITNQLLDYYKIPYVSLSKPRLGIWGMISEMLTRDLKILKLHLKKKFNFAIGTSVSIGHLSFLTKVHSYNFNEDDDDVILLYTIAAYPFCSKIINPACLRYNKYRHKRIIHNSYQKLAYLHPDNFTPDVRVLEKYRLKPQAYIVMRLSALSAHHDVGAEGISGKLKEQLLELLDGYELITSTENDASYDIEPWDMHHVLAFAKLLVTDSMSMSVEAAVMGIPSVRYNSFVGRSSVLDELENKYGLTYGFAAGQRGEAEKMVKKISELLNMAHLREEWQKKRSSMLVDKVDMNKWMIRFFESEIKDKT